MKNMIPEVVKFFLLLIGGGFSWWVLDKITTIYIEIFLSRYPSAFDSQAIAFVQAVWQWFLLFMVLGALYGLFISIQRKPQPEGWL